MLTLCLHCGLPAGAASPDGAAAFCCYGCRLAHQIWRVPGTADAPGARAATTTLARLLLACFFAMASMTFSVALYASACYPPAAGSDHALGPLAPVLQWLAVAFAAPVIALLGAPLLLHAVSGRQRREGTAAVNALIVAGAAAAYGLSIANLLRGSGEVYVETAVMLLVLVTLGRALDARARARTNRAMLDLLAADAQSAWRLDPAAPGASPVRVALAEVQVGDLLRVAAGDRVPVDGSVVAGSAAADEALLTGEPEPREIGAGDLVRAGSLVVDGKVDMRTTAALGDRLLDRIACLSIEAREHRMPLEKLSAVVSAWFLPVSLLAALAASLVTAWQSGAGSGVLRGLAVLLISCPCALGIATPLAAWVAIGRAARRGVLVRGSDVFEKLARVRRVFVDKTGTLTSRELRLVRTITAPGISHSEILELASALAVCSTHPASVAIARRAAEEGLKPAPVAGFQALPGLGLRGEVGGRTVLLGSRRLLERHGDGVFRGGWTLAGELEEAADVSWVQVAAGGAVLGAFAFEEALRPEAPEAIAELRGLGCTVEVLTGDTPARGRRLEEFLGVAVHAGLLPGDKVDRVARARGIGDVTAMVGDGHNDAPVISAADVGMALGSGTEIARESADIVLLDLQGAPLAGVPYITRLARRTVRRIRLNLFWAFGYNTCGMILGAAGLVHPVLAAGLMIASSLFVVAVSTAAEPEPPRAREEGTAARAVDAPSELAPC